MPYAVDFNTVSTVGLGVVAGRGRARRSAGARGPHSGRYGRSSTESAPAATWQAPGSSLPSVEAKPANP